MADQRLNRTSVRDRVKSLPEEEHERLLKETRDVLDAHAEIQREHRDQAKWILRVYAAGVGLLIAALAWTWGQFRTIFATGVPVPEGAVATGGFAASALFSVVGIRLLIRSLFGFVGVLELVTAVLTPRKFEVGSWPLRVLRLAREYETTIGADVETSANETVERAVEAERLLDSVKQPPPRVERILVDRLSRIQRNERSINRDMKFLKAVYKSMSKSLADALVGAVLTAVATELPLFFT